MQNLHFPDSMPDLPNRVPDECWEVLELPLRHLCQPYARCLLKLPRWVLQLLPSKLLYRMPVRILPLRPSVHFQHLHLLVEWLLPNRQGVWTLPDALLTVQCYILYLPELCYRVYLLSPKPMHHWVPQRNLPQWFGLLALPFLLLVLLWDFHILLRM